VPTWTSAPLGCTCVSPQYADVRHACLAVERVVSTINLVDALSRSGQQGCGCRLAVGGDACCRDAACSFLGPLGRRPRRGLGAPTGPKSAPNLTDFDSRNRVKLGVSGMVFARRT
jgi:hypothetical protein